MIRARDAILRARTLLINSARSIAKGFGLRLPKSITGTFGERAIEALWKRIGNLLDEISSSEPAAYLRHDGYGAT